MRKLRQFDTKLPRPTPTDPNDPTDPPRSKTATRRPASCHRPRSCPESTPYAGNDSRARFGRPKASSLIPLGARIAGAKRRPRDAELCAGSPVDRARHRPSHWIRGQRPPEAGNRARQFFAELAWPKTAALGFGRPRRPRCPRPRGKPANDAKHRLAADATTLKGDPRAEGRRIIQPTLWGFARIAPRRGGQRSLRGVLKRERKPKTPRPPAWGKRPS